MKRIVLFLIFAASLASVSLQAQDTVWMKPAPLGNYFCDRWIDTTYGVNLHVGSMGNCHVGARQFFSRDTLQVYGIAAMMTDQFFGHFEPNSVYPDLQSYLNVAYPMDPSYENCEEELYLYQYDENDSALMLQQGEALPVHILYTPVSYYVMANTPPMINLDSIAKPVYERYFTTPQTVHDTFYVGVSEHFHQISKTDSVWHQVRPEFLLVYASKLYSYEYLDGVEAYLFQDSLQNPAEWLFRRNYIRQYGFIFPILTPPDTTNPGDTVINPGDTIIPGDTILNPADTLVILPGDTLVIGGDTIVNTGDTVIVPPGGPVVIGGDTIAVGPGDTIIVIPGGTPGVGLRQTDLLYRYTALQPNPATDKVRITSSFGLSRIEAYDAKGRLVKELSIPNSQFSINLDVSSWPRGAYLLRIHTPAGTTTKKLLIQ